MALRILIADDSSTVRAVIAKALHMGHVPVAEIYNAANGAEALEVLRSNWVDLVLTDLTMPVMGGVELVARMAQEDLLKSIPVIVVSTEGSATRLDELRAKGIAGYVRKPFTPESLTKTIMETVGGAAQ